MEDTFSYSLVEGDGGVDNPLFVINGDKLKIKNIQGLGTKDSYSVESSPPTLVD